MKTVCLILIVAGRLLTIDKPFPNQDACEIAGFGMTDGQTVKDYTCVPRDMVDGLPTYDCGDIKSDLILTPPPSKCTFTVMGLDGRTRSISAACNADVPGTISITAPEPRPPVPKYQERME